VPPQIFGVYDVPVVSGWCYGGDHYSWVLDDKRQQCGTELQQPFLRASCCAQHGMVGHRIEYRYCLYIILKMHLALPSYSWNEPTVLNLK
jgi:hypothetical protein